MVLCAGELSFETIQRSRVLRSQDYSFWQYFRIYRAIAFSLARPALNSSRRTSESTVYAKEETPIETWS